MTISQFLFKKIESILEPGCLRENLLLDAAINRVVVPFTGQWFPAQAIQEHIHNLAEGFERFINPGHDSSVGVPAHDMASHSCGSDAEDDLFGRHFALWKVTCLKPLGDKLMHRPETAATLHPVLVLPRLI